MVNALHSIITEILPRFGCDSLTGDYEECCNSSHEEVGRGTSQSQFKFFPYAHFILMDEWDFDKRFEPSVFPSEDATHLANWIRNTGSDGQLSVQFGDFLASYSEGTRKNTFDLVVTCFFIDTATDIMDYLSVIAHVLKPEGLWINAGPLHYHGGHTKFPYSQKHLERVIKALGFEEEVPRRTLEATYCSEEEAFMKPDYYSFPLSTWRLVRKRDDITAMFSCHRNEAGGGRHDQPTCRTLQEEEDYVAKEQNIYREHKDEDSVEGTETLAENVDRTLYEPSVNYIIL
jgi:hypothetical protein